MFNRKTKGKKTQGTEVQSSQPPENEPVAGEQAVVEEPLKISKVLPPVASGDDKITILKHDLYIRSEKDGTEVITGVELLIVNISDTTIGSALFEAVFFDEKGDTLDTVEHKFLELIPNNSHTFRIITSITAAEKVKSYQVRILKRTMTPPPTVTGDEKLIILKHSLFEEKTDDDGTFHPTEVEFAIRNISELTISTVVFEAAFFDIEGNVIDTARHKEMELKSGYSRAAVVRSSVIESDKVKSYDIKIARITTTDIEKAQLRRQEMTTLKTGEKEVTGTVKNISEASINTAVVATLYNYNNESIGTRVIVIKDIEPGTIRSFNLLFKPQEGDKVRSFTLQIGDIVE